MAGNENLDPSLTAVSNDLQDLEPINAPPLSNSNTNTGGSTALSTDCSAGGPPLSNSNTNTGGSTALSTDCSAGGIIVPACRSAKERMPRRPSTFGGINSKRRKDDAEGMVSPRAWMSCKQQEEIEALFELWGGKLRGR
jgi:hypothetical protein